MTMAYARTTLRGTVTRGGAPLARAYVQLRDADGEFTGEWRTRADGAFLFHVSPGPWSVVVLTAGGAKVERTVEVPAGDAVLLDIEMDAPGPAGAPPSH
jgi:hypothetical protein